MGSPSPLIRQAGGRRDEASLLLSCRQKSDLRSVLAPAVVIQDFRNGLLHTRSPPFFLPEREKTKSPSFILKDTAQMLSQVVFGLACFWQR